MMEYYQLFSLNKNLLGIALIILGTYGMFKFKADDHKFTQALVLWIGGLIICL